MDFMIASTEIVPLRVMVIRRLLMKMVRDLDLNTEELLIQLPKVYSVILTLFRYTFKMKTAGERYCLGFFWQILWSFCGENA